MNCVVYVLNLNYEIYKFSCYQFKLIIKQSFETCCQDIIIIITLFSFIKCITMTILLFVLNFIFKIYTASLHNNMCIG